MTKICFAISKDAGSRTNLMLVPNPDTMDYVNQYGLSRKHIFNGVKVSLKRLQLDYIDVLQCHRFDLQTPVEEMI